MTRVVKRALFHVALVLGVVGLTASCTLKQGSDYQVDASPMGWYATIYQVPSMMIVTGLFFPCGWEINCTVDLFKHYMEVKGEKSAEMWSALDDHRTGNGGFEWTLRTLGVDIEMHQAGLQEGSRCIELVQHIFESAYWTLRPKEEAECRYN